MRVSVIVPTFRRSSDLHRCLEKVFAQSHSPFEVIVVVREEDSETANYLKQWAGNGVIRSVQVHEPGQVAALNRGLDEARGDIVAFTDDDGAPHADWLKRAVNYFASDDSVGGVGGRDHVFWRGEEVKGTAIDVGRVQWFGRCIGNHHIGAGAAREVQILKGANMLFRRAAIGDLRFDRRLRGSGAQVHNDLMFSLRVHRNGWKLIYDPLVAIDHYPGQRHDSEKRGALEKEAVFNLAYNETLSLWHYLPTGKRAAALCYWFFVGPKVSPGLVHAALFFRTGGAATAARILVALSGRLAALAFIASHRK